MKKGIRFIQTSFYTVKYFLFLLSLIVWGCIPEPLDVNGLPVVKPQIVVSTQIIPDQSLVVLLTKTFGALDASDDSDPEVLLNQIAVDDAIVKITGSDEVYELQSLGNGAYGGLIIPFQAGNEYHLHVQSESLGEVSAKTTVKPMVSFDAIKAELVFNGFDDTLAQITYRMADPMGKNWYMLNVQQIESDEVIENLLNPQAYTRLMDDEDFEGEVYQETFRVFPTDFIPGDTIVVSLSNISEEYADFIQLRIDNRYSFVEFLSEPVNYPSNITGGKGFFNLYIPDIQFFILEY